MPMRSRRSRDRLARHHTRHCSSHSVPLRDGKSLVPNHLPCGDQNVPSLGKKMAFRVCHRCWQTERDPIARARRLFMPFLEPHRILALACSGPPRGPARPRKPHCGAPSATRFQLSSCTGLCSAGMVAAPPTNPLLFQK